MTTKACISPGACGLQTTVLVRSEGLHCVIAIDSICAFVQSLADELTEVNPLHEVFMQDDIPRILQLAVKHGLHAGCPVPVGILKTIEVEAGVALPADVSITLSRE